MSVARFTLQNIVDLIRLNLGELVAANSKIADADPTDSGSAGQGQTGLYNVVNNYLQSLPLRVAGVMKELGVSPKDGVVQLSMWRTGPTALTASAGSSTVTFPADYYRWISFWDTTYLRSIFPITPPGRFSTRRVIRKAPGPPERIVIGGFSSGARQGTLYPGVLSGVTPTINLEYYRLPARMDPATTSPASTYPDIDPAFQDLCIVGPTVKLLGSDDPSFSRFKEEEHALLVGLAYTAYQEAG